MLIIKYLIDNINFFCKNEMKDIERIFQLMHFLYFYVIGYGHNYRPKKYKIYEIFFSSRCKWNFFIEFHGHKWSFSTARGYFLCVLQENLFLVLNVPVDCDMSQYDRFQRELTSVLRNRVLPENYAISNTWWWLRG